MGRAVGRTVGKAVGSAVVRTVRRTEGDAEVGSAEGIGDGLGYGAVGRGVGDIVCTHAGRATKLLEYTIDEYQHAPGRSGSGRQSPAAGTRNVTRVGGRRRPSLQFRSLIE